jgi:hypothetical protein
MEYFPLLEFVVNSGNFRPLHASWQEGRPSGIMTGYVPFKSRLTKKKSAALATLLL